MTLDIQKHREQLELDAKKVQFMIEVLKLEENKELSPELLLEICQDCQRVQRTITNLQTDLNSFIEIVTNELQSQTQKQYPSIYAASL